MVLASDAEIRKQTAKSLLNKDFKDEIERYEKGFNIYKNSVSARAAPLVCPLRGMSDVYQQTMDANLDADPTSTVKDPRTQEVRLWKDISDRSSCNRLELTIKEITENKWHTSQGEPLSPFKINDKLLRENCPKLLNSAGTEARLWHSEEQMMADYRDDSWNPTLFGVLYPIMHKKDPDGKPEKAIIMAESPIAVAAVLYLLKKHAFNPDSELYFGVKKTVVWFHHSLWTLREMEDMKRRFNQESDTNSKLTEGTNPDVILLTSRSGSTGHNFQGARHMIFLEYLRSFSDYRQALFRNNRLVSKWPTFNIVLHSPDAPFDVVGRQSVDAQADNRKLMEIISAGENWETEINKDAKTYTIVGKNREGKILRQTFDLY